MRIAFVAPRFAPDTGGVETHVERIAERAAAEGWRVAVLTQQTERAREPAQRHGDLTIHRFPSVIPGDNYSWSPALWMHLRRRRADYELVHAHSYHSLCALGPALLRSRPLVFTPHFHGTGHSCIRRALHYPYRPLGAQIFASAQRVICVSDAEAELVRQRFPRASDRIRVIPNGVDVGAIRAAPPHRLDSPSVLCAGRLEPYKNVAAVIDAMSELDGFSLWVVGEGPARPALERHMARLRLGGRVTFLGRVSDAELHRWYRSVTAYVSMSRQEAFGITPREALSGGAGLVLSDIPAHRELARELPTDRARLVPIDAAPGALARAIREATAGGRSEAPGPVATWDDVASRTMIAYREVLADFSAVAMPCG